MDQVLAIQKVQEKIKDALAAEAYKNPEKSAQLLQEIYQDLSVFLAQGVDFKIVVDSLDDSIFITDKDGVCLYVNPAHQRNTTILPEEVIGRKVSDIVEDGTLFTGGATLDVLKTQKKVFRLSTVQKTNPPSVGYAVGVPIFDQNGNLHQVVVSSRPILTLQSLQEDFGKFLAEANALDKSRENVRILESTESSKRLVGSSYTLQKVWNTIQMAAPTDATVLITGESGVGKDLQVKLLRAIQNKEITRVGGTKPIKLDIRFIAATNSDLKRKIAEGTFRQDLYYRLNVIPIYIPPLRERLNDLDDLCRHFVEYFTEKHGRPFTLTDDQLEIMKQYTWPGNIRELENVIEYLTICASGTKEVADEMLRGLLDISQGDEIITSTGTLSQSLENYEKSLIESVLRDSNSLRDAGAKLGVNASTISRKIKQYGIDYPGAK